MSTDADDYRNIGNGTDFKNHSLRETQHFLKIYNFMQIYMEMDLDEFTSIKQ